jgi:hypothetical protein
MKMCLAPCYKGCTDERYSEESNAVESFLATRGESRLVTLRTERDQASVSLEFESAASLHTQVQRAEAVRSLAPELVRPLSQLRAIILQASANPDEVAVFLFENARLRGPATFSTLGMRIQNEQSGSSSLFAQPMLIEPIPEPPELFAAARSITENTQDTEEAHDLKGHGFSRADSGQEDQRALAPEGSLTADQQEAANKVAKLPRGLLESRMEGALASLADPSQPPSATLRQGHLALLKRWYYRPEVRRSGEIFFPDPEGRWPIKAVLRGIGRVAAKMLIANNRA